MHISVQRGILFTKLIALRERDFRLKMPIAATLPSKVDAVAASRAMVIGVNQCIHQRMMRTCSEK